MSGGLRLRSLDAVRGVAALLVLLFHVNEMFVGGRFGSPRDLLPLLRAGYAGVDVFFVLSGFLMVSIYRERIGQPGEAARFLKRRALRILPLYWVVTLALLPFYFLVPDAGAGNERDPAHILASLTLLPTGDLPIVGVGWTLQLELYFYLLFALMLGRPRIGVPLLGFVVIGGLVAPLFFWPLPLGFLLSHYMPLFALGGLAAILRLREEGGRVLTALGLQCFSLAFYYEPELGADTARWAFGATAAMTIAGLRAIEQAKVLALPRPLIFLGEASYALYLVHYFAIAAAAMLLPPLPDAPTAFLLIAAGLAAGFVLHFALEKPMLMLADPAARIRSRAALA